MIIEIHEIDTTIPLQDLKDGQFAVITEWKCYCYVGLIVKRYGRMLIAMNSHTHWDEFYVCDSEYEVENIRCRVLPPGTLLEIKADDNPVL